VHVCASVYNLHDNPKTIADICVMLGSYIPGRLEKNLSVCMSGS